MVTSFSVAKDAEYDIEYLKEWCKSRGISKSFVITELISDWVRLKQAEEKSECTTSTH